MGEGVERGKRSEPGASRGWNEVGGERMCLEGKPPQQREEDKRIIGDRAER